MLQIYNSHHSVLFVLFRVIIFLSFCTDFFMEVFWAFHLKSKIKLHSWAIHTQTSQLWHNCDFIMRSQLIKGKANSQGILKWIIQILHYYCRKQHKNIENSQIIEQNLVTALLPFTLFTTACTFLTFLAAKFFQFIKRHKWSFVKYIVSFFGSKWFSPR